MRHLLNTLFVLTEDCYLTLDGENVVVSREKAETARFPLHTLESILCFTYPGASPSLMGACAGHGIDLCFFSPRGRFLARAVGEERGNVLLRRQQHRVADSGEQRRGREQPGACPPYCYGRGSDGWLEDGYPDERFRGDGRFRLPDEQGSGLGRVGFLPAGRDGQGRGAPQRPL